MPQWMPSPAGAVTGDFQALSAVALHTDTPVAVLDAARRVRWANPAMLALCARPADEVIGYRVRRLFRIAGDQRPVLRRLMQALAAGEAFRGELGMRARLSGVYHLLRLEVQAFGLRGNRSGGYLVVCSDITAERTREIELKDSRTLLARISALAGMAGWTKRISESTITWTDQMPGLHRVDCDLVPTIDSVLAFYPEPDRTRLADAFRVAESTGQGWDMELRHIGADGRLDWLRSVAEVEYEDGKPVRLLGALQDITETMRQRQVLEDERLHLSMILEGTDAGTWEWNVQTGEVRLNERWASQIGYTLGELEPIDIDTWISLTHPEDGREAHDRLQRHFAGETPGYACELRMRHKDGHWVWVMARGRVFTRSADGKPGWMFGTHLDISERKATETRLADREALLSITLRSIGDAVLTTDELGRVTWLNPAAEALTGWSQERASGCPASLVLDLRIEGRDERPPCPIDVCLREGRKVGVAGDTVLASGDGRRHVIEDSAAPLLDAQGTLCGAVMIFRDITEKATLAREMNYRISHDFLTGLLNRAEFEIRLGLELERLRQAGGEGAVMFLDLDHFKLVNDACGHAAGDRLLMQVAEILGCAVRMQDAVARFGGDEFAILLGDCPLAQAKDSAARILQGIEDYRFVSEDGRRFRIGVSIGLVPLGAASADVTSVIKNADAACYLAKAEGRGRVVLDESGRAAAMAAGSGGIEWGALIGQALDDDQFELHAQRIVPLGSDAGAHDPLHCEVLLRLRDGKGGLLSPGLFIPAAERYQLASRIDRWVLRHVLGLLAESGTDGLARVAINCSGQSVGDRAFHRHVIQSIRDSGVPPQVLCIEITETAAVTNLADAAHFIEALRALGVTVALDDFGSGVASYGYLKSLRVDKLKIDGQFVRGVLDGALEAAAIRSFVDVAGVLGIATVAEQIESAEVAERLRGMGVDYGQGFHFHRPGPLADVLATWGRSRP